LLCSSQRTITHKYLPAILSEKEKRSEADIFSFLIRDPKHSWALQTLSGIVLQTDVWPISKETLKRKHFKIFVKFTNEISFDKFNEVSNPLPQAS
jgi:hypothetical protein